LLEFEHLVQVNDLANSTLTVITRSQLWQGLVLRARNPEKFNHGLNCQSEEVSNNKFLRTIEAGGSKFCEEVVLEPEQRIHTATLAELEQLQSESTTTIEEPEAGYLFVRFHYKRELLVDTESVDVAEHLKSAYVQVDRDAVAMIRVLAESQLFDGPIN
jgi:hypothetical protein